MYEGGIRVPGILHWPGKTKPGSLERTPVISTDLFPILLGALDIPLPIAYREGDWVLLADAKLDACELCDFSVDWQLPLNRKRGSTASGVTGD